MKNYNENKFKNPFEIKDIYMEEAWDYFKIRENIPITHDRLYFELHKKNTDLGEKWGAFKHTYTSAAFTKTYGRNAAKLLGDLNEIQQLGTVKSLSNEKKYMPGNEPQDRRMDLKNNAAGRKIGLQNIDLNLLDEVYYSLTSNKDIVLNQHKNNNKPFNDNFLMNKIWKTADKGYDETQNALKKSSSSELENGPYKNKKASNYDDLLLTGQIEYTKPISLREKLTRAREEKMQFYMSRLADDPEKVKEREAKHVSLEQIKSPQESKLQKLKDKLSGNVKFDEDLEITSYENKRGKTNKIFTKEEINSMNPKERYENKQAIAYQKESIGIPTKEQADKAVSKGGMVFVNGYTRSDGVEVKSYYRSR